MTPQVRPRPNEATSVGCWNQSRSDCRLTRRGRRQHVPCLPGRNCGSYLAWYSRAQVSIPPPGRASSLLPHRAEPPRGEERGPAPALSNWESCWCRASLGRYLGWHPASGNLPGTFFFFSPPEPAPIRGQRLQPIPARGRKWDLPRYDPLFPPPQSRSA